MALSMCNALERNCTEHGVRCRPEASPSPAEIRTVRSWELSALPPPVRCSFLRLAAPSLPPHLTFGVAGAGGGPSEMGLARRAGGWMGAGQ